jgi:gliding motility-associated-like protein
MSKYIQIFAAFFAVMALATGFAQPGVGPAPYCFPMYSAIPCNQPGPSNSPGNGINDFINSFNTTGGIVNITNNNSGCNAQTFPGQGLRNYFYFGCTHYLQANPGQVITCNFQSGITFAQGFAVFVDWDQNNTFNTTNERVVTTGVPAAGTWVAGNFTIPAGTPAGVYRLRVRCAYVTAGNAIDECSIYGFGEGEDYNLYVSSAPAGVITATASSNSPLCSGSSINLNVNHSSTAPVSFTWSGPGNYSATVQSPVIPNATATMSGVYNVTVSSGPCPATHSVNVQVTNYPTFTLTPLTATVCQGSTFQASVDLGTLPGTPCSTTGLGPVCASPAIKDVGTGGSVSSSWQPNSPYNKYYYDSHQQIIYRASELLAAGVQAGYITNLAFNVAAPNNVNNITNFTIKIKCTTASVTTAFDNVGLTQVFTSPSYNPVNGWNTHTFATPYYWDGQSNLLIDLCQGNAPWTFMSASVFMDNVGYNCFLYGGQFGPGSTSCGMNNITGTYTDRPNTRFGNCPSVLPQWFTFNWLQGPGISSPTAQSTSITAQPITGTISTVSYTAVVTPTAYSCPTSSVLSITVLNPASPTITPVSPLCNTFNTIAISATPGGGTWTTNGAVSAGGVITPSLATIGTSTVLYSVGMGSCISTGTTSIEVSQFNSAAFSSSIAPLCVTSPPVNLFSIVQNTVAGTWVGPNVSGTYTFNPAGLNTNTYSLVYNTVSTPNATVCPASSTMIVSVLNPPTPTITAVGPYCNTSPTVQLVVTPTTGTWTPVTYQNASGVFNPSIAAIGTNTVQYIIGTNTCNTQSTLPISVEAFVPSTITGTIADQCNTSPQVNLLPLTSVGTGTWSGSGVLGSVFNPGTSGTGAIILTHSTQSVPSGLCPDQSTLAVNVYSLASPALSQIGPFCNTHLPMQIPVTPLGGMFSGVNTNAVSQTGMFNPSQAQIGNNYINYSVTSGPCVAFGQATISVEQFVQAGFSNYAGPFCRNNPPINLNSIAINAGGMWAGPGVNGSMFNPAQANPGNNNLITHWTFSSPTASLCPDSASIQILVNEIPQVTITSNTKKGCTPVEVIFSVPNTSSGHGLWNLGDGTVKNAIAFTHTYTTPGSYTVTFNYEDEIGCATQTVLSHPIEVYEMPRAFFTFSPNELTMVNPEVQFTNLSTVLGNNTYEWLIGNMYLLSEVNPKVVFPMAKDYNVILTATTIHGCKDVYSAVVSVKNDYGVYIPSSFTPNFDGLNDYFMPVFSPYGVDLSVFEMEIFDRWGHSLFKTKDHTIGWDGMAKGTDEPLKQDVYVYKIRYKDSDGKIHNKTGHVSILK